MESTSTGGGDGGIDGVAPPNPNPTSSSSSSKRFEFTLSSGEVIELNLSEMFNNNSTSSTSTSTSSRQESIDQLNDLCQMLISEGTRVSVSVWVRFVSECWNRGRLSSALHYADQGITALGGGSSKEIIPLLLLKANYNLSLSRKAPKFQLKQPRTDPISLPKDIDHPESLHSQTIWPGGQSQSQSGPPRLIPMFKQDYFERVEKDLQRVELLDKDNKTVKDLRASLLLSRGKLEDANKLFQEILKFEPNHLMALTGRARILFSKLSFRPALKIYQQILMLEPTFLPDPRIGIGLCFYFLNDRDKAKKAWERSLIVNPNNSTSAETLLGLLHLNRSKNPLLPGGETQRTKNYSIGLKYLQNAFKKDNTIAACMGPLGNHLFISQTSSGGGGNSRNAMKLYERSLQFSETRLLISESHFNLGRALEATTTTTGDGNSEAEAALLEYQRSLEANPDSIISQLSIARLYIQQSNFPAAINSFENVLKKTNQLNIESLVCLGSIYCYLSSESIYNTSQSDVESSRKLAKECFDSVLRIFAKGKQSGTTTSTSNSIGDSEVSSFGGSNKLEVSKSERIRNLAKDRDLFIEMAKLWQQDEVKVDKSLKAWQEARRIEVDKYLLESQEEEEEEEEVLLERAERKVDSRIRNNIAVLLYNQKHYDLASEEFELALGTIGKDFVEKGNSELDGGEIDAVLTRVTYNLACCYEKLGQNDKAREGWENVLRGHPEFVEAKARLALLELQQTSSSKDKSGCWDRAHVHLKQALTSHPNSLELRSLYVYFLFETFQLRQARDFARQTLKEVSRHDLYCLCACGIFSYLEARENKLETKEAVKDRQARFTRSAEFFDKALQLDPMCAVAAQGLAIALAEGNLGNNVDPSSTTSSTSTTTPTPQDSQAARQRNARDALLILTKVKESINDASVYVNLGHCHLSRDEFEKASENYLTASKRYLSSQSSTVLWYISRSYYFKALKESNFKDLEKSIEFGQQATDLHPEDLSNVFNMAVLKQKGIEILYQKSNESRSSDQLNKAYEYLESSQSLFNQLISDKTPVKPYQPDYPRHRSSYGRSLESRFQSILEQQLAYEQTEQGKINQARQAREEARQRQLIEQEKLEQERLRRQEALAEQRKKMREETEQWNSMSKAWAESDDEGTTSTTKGGKKTGGAGGGKKRKSTKIKGGEESEASSTDEDGEKPKKKKKAAAKKEKKSKKGKATGGDRMEVEENYDEDDEDAPIRAPGRNKRKGKSSALVKSAEFIDSEEED